MYTALPFAHPNFKSFHKSCQAVGISLYFLYGLQYDGYTFKDKALKLISEALATNYFQGVHLDIEIRKGSVEAYNQELKLLLDSLKDYYVQFDVETWRKDKKYWELVNQADESHLMSYASNRISALWNILKSRARLKKIYHFGLEASQLNQERFLRRLLFWDKKLKGVSLHHYASLKEIK